MAATAARDMQDNLAAEVCDDNTAHHEFPMLKTSDQAMETNGSDELGKHLETLINDVDTKEAPQDKEISFRGGHSFFRPPSFARAFVT